MSVRGSTAFPSTCSGATYLAVPTMRPGWVRSAPSAALAMPKSATFTRPSPASSTLAGLMSRWTRPARWAASSASATWAARPAACHGSIGAGSSMRSRQRAARDQLHHDRLGAGLRARVVDRDDPGVSEAGGGDRLLAEAGDEAAVGGQVRVEQLHGDLAPQDLVGPAPHLGHPARGDELFEPVPARRAAGRTPPRRPRSPKGCREVA